MHAARLLLLLALLIPPLTRAQTTLAPPSNAEARRYVLSREPALSHDAKLKLVRDKIKYVFVLFQENRSFDFYFATYPGADGLFSQPPAATPGFVQPIVNTDGSVSTISPFKIPFTVTDVRGHTVPLYPSDLASVNHSHTGLVRKLDLDSGNVAQNDRYAITEEGLTLDSAGHPSKTPTLERKQFGELVMSHIDCDAAPFLWRYADRFTLFDRFFDTVIGPSGPNAIAMIAGQSGETQWMLHPELAAGSAGAVNALPLTANALPYWGSLLDKDKRTPSPEPRPAANPAPNLTFATLPLSFMGADIRRTTASDLNPAFDLLDVQADIDKIAAHKLPPTHWAWYQQGFDREPNDPAGDHSGYVVHHNATMYFGYIADNPAVSSHVHGLNQFFTDIAARALPNSGVFYVRGGYGNISSESPLDPNPDLATVFHGNDDHPGYSDSQLSESLLAREINAIARSPYWSQSLILIAYDESDGLYDHARPRIRSHAADGSALDQGPRIPALLISPYAATHIVSHELAEHSSIIKLVDELFGLIPLADLPDEARARQIGVDQYHQKDLGPADDHVEGVGDLLSGFSNARLLGRAQPLPAAYAEIPDTDITAYPHLGGQGCSALRIRPTDTGRPNPIPADFNPRPDTTPGIPTSGTWTP